jgi:hypothetical protein
MEEPDMPDTWMTVAEAAAALKCHPRTIERRIAGGKLQARRADDGLLQVLIDLPDAPEPASEAAFETVRELAADQVSLATGSASAIVKIAQSDALHAREELAIARQDVGRARRGALVAWLIVATMGLGACGAVGWTTSKMTRAQMEVETLNKRADAIQRENEKLATQIDSARQEAQVAKVDAAKASGELAAYKQAHEKEVEIAARTRPTTQPTWLQALLSSAPRD